MALAMPIIPYLLSFVLPENIAPIFSPVYTFNVDVTTLFINTSTQPTWIAYVGRSFDLTCRPRRKQVLKCYIEEIGINYSPHHNDITVNHVFTPSYLNYSNINFTMHFDTEGIAMLNIEEENVENISSLILMYEMIGDQLSIGSDIKQKGYGFYSAEKSVLGVCPTFYSLSKTDDFRLNLEVNYMLSGLMHDKYFKLNKNESLFIVKNRAVQKCCKDCDYILGMALWTDLFLTTDFHVEMVNSTSYMLLNEHYFYSMTENLFDLYDVEKNVLGNVKEQIEVNLLTVEI